MDMIRKGRKIYLHVRTKENVEFEIFGTMGQLRRTVLRSYVKKSPSFDDFSE
jgi:hypothetical protein